METENQNRNILKGYNMLLYFAGSMIMFPPSKECVVDFWEKGILKNLPVSSSNPNFVLASSQLRESFKDKDVLAEMLTEDYKRLFAEDGLKLAPAFESEYCRNIDSNCISKSDSVTDFYNSYGWNSKFRKKISDDHLGIEILFLTRLIDNYITLEDNACRGAMSNEIVRFISNHLLSWIGEWNAKVQIHSRSISYKAIATLIVACVQDIEDLVKTDNPVLYADRFSKN
jgi:putative dimethyl sulfoxide reductase chaperone